MFIKRYFFWAILLVLLVGCEKDEEAVKVIDAPKVYFGNRGIIVEWKPTDVSGFRYYQVLRSTDGKDFTEVYGHLNDDEGSSDINHTTYTDIVYPFADSVYYKVAAYGNGKIESQKVGLAIPAPMELDYDPSAGYIMPEREEILFFKGYDARGTRFSLYDYRNGIKKKELKLEVEVSGFTQGFGKFKGNYECYFHDSWKTQMDIYDALNFDYKGSFDFEQPYSSVTSDFSNFIYYKEFRDILIVNRNTLNTTRYSNKENVMLASVQYMESQNKLIAVTDPKGISLFELGDSGTIVNEFHKKLNNVDIINYIQGTKYIHTEALNSSKIINTENWEEKSLLDEHGKTLYPGILHAKNGILYAVSGQKIYCYSLDKLELIEYFPARIEPYMLLSDDKDLILISRTFGHTAIIDKMKLSQ